MNKVILLILFFLIPSFFAQERVMDYYFYADSVDPENMRDGSEQHPYKYLSELPSSVSGSVKLYFYSANASYQYHPNGPYDNILKLKDCSRIWIERIDEGTVTFSGNSIYENGIVISPSCSYIRISGINFESFWHNSLHIDGTAGDIISDINISDCNFFSNHYKDGSTDRNCAAIRINYASNVSITDCNITQGNYDAQLDGLYIQYTNGFLMRNNTVILQNNQYVSQHLDCLQMNSDCSDATIENNYFENASTTSANNRQGIYITGTKGEIKIVNNVIISRGGKGLINLSTDDETQALKIYNNTLMGQGNPGHLCRIVCQDISSTEILNIKNNIFFREGTGISAYTQTLVFEDVTSDFFSNDILNHNLHYITNPLAVPQIEFNDATFDWNEQPDLFERDGVGEKDPLFETNYSLNYYSPAKNKGTGLLSEGVIKDKFGNDRPYWNKDFDIGAFEIEDTQLKLGVTGLDNENLEVTHSLTSIGHCWERNSSGNWIVSSDLTLQSASYTTIGNSPDTLNALRGMEYKWLDWSNDSQEKRIAAGFYKVTNNFNPDVYFYLDLRDAVTNNVFIQFSHYQDSAKYRYFKNNTWKNDITNGSIVGIWEINGNSRNISSLANYWKNSLVFTDSVNRPLLRWHSNSSATSYKIYRALSATPVNPSSLTYTNIITVNSSTLRYLDVDIRLNQSPLTYAYYYVEAYNNNTYLDRTNTISSSGEYLPQKRGSDSESKDELFTYSLNQNYPNPFNPVTRLSYSIAKEEHVLLRIYDCLGREVRTLVNENKLPGVYNIDFNGDGLSSGIYFCRITAGQYTDIKKMQLIK
jgi:hypothetical protein